jgi:transposase
MLPRWEQSLRPTEADAADRRNPAGRHRSASPEKKAVVEALQALRGVAKLTAITIVTEAGTFQRFNRPNELMAYTGLVPSEYSSGSRESKGRVTRTGNARLRRILGEAAWHARLTGYALYWQLTELGVDCEVVAPSLIPRKPGERIKTDRRDAEKLAECYRGGLLTAV